MTPILPPLVFRLAPRRQKFQTGFPVQAAAFSVHILSDVSLPVSVSVISQVFQRADSLVHLPVVLSVS